MRKIILGTDWWTDCDDAVAIRMLARAHKAGEIKIEGIVINACMEYSVTSLEGFLNTEGVRDIPIGIDRDATDYNGKPPYQKRLSAHAEKYTSNNEAEDGVRLYRKLLSAAEMPIELVDIGYLQVLSALLQSPADDISALTGRELVKAKVSKIWMMAGKWDKIPDTENNFARTPRSRRAAHIFCKECPVPVTFLGWEVAADVISGDKLIKDDPLYLALHDFGTETGRESWDPMLCHMALVGDEEKAGYTLVRGRADVDAESGKNYFEEDESGPHAYVVRRYDAAHYADIINDMIR